MKNIVMRVGDNYKTRYELNIMRQCTDFENMVIIEPSTRNIGYLAEPPIQSNQYKPYYSSGPIETALLKSTTNDLSDYISNDEYSQDFEKVYGRKPKKSENLVYIGPKDNPRLVVMKRGDYNKWANNITPIEPDDPLLVEIAKSNPYRIIMDDDGVRVKKLVLNPSSTSTAYCSNCNKLHLIRSPVVIERNDKEDHFCSDKCRMAYKSPIHPRFNKINDSENKD